jgi:hypothetical protein
MAVFVYGSDEYSGGDARGSFLFAGYIGPEEDWSRFFTPAWKQRVLDGPPEIPYLHMTDIRSKKWRERWGISKLAAEDRVDEAASVINNMGSFYPVAVEVGHSHVKDVFAEAKVRREEAKQFEAKPFVPDYLCFVTYAHTVLDYVRKKHPHVEKVDFIVEKKGYITRYINEFHSGLARALTAIGRTDLSPLVGALSIGDKARIPCQAADFLCWHAGRFENAQEVKPEDYRDGERYLKLRNRNGLWLHLPNSVLCELAAGLLKLQSPSV